MHTQLDPEFLAILVCPICKGPLEHQPRRRRFICRAEKIAFPISDQGIPILLAQEATPLKDPSSPSDAD